jgi:hypothetical protein
MNLEIASPEGTVLQAEGDTASPGGTVLRIPFLL